MAFLNWRYQANALIDATLRGDGKIGPEIRSSVHQPTRKGQPHTIGTPEKSGFR
jgi:hypothetical protein